MIDEHQEGFVQDFRLRTATGADWSWMYERARADKEPSPIEVVSRMYENIDEDAAARIPARYFQAMYQEALDSIFGKDESPD